MFTCTSPQSTAGTTYVRPQRTARAIELVYNRGSHERNNLVLKGKKVIHSVVIDENESWVNIWKIFSYYFTSLVGND